jgi:DNA-directed RNA polymerase subunit RPC12/RpoP
MTRSKTFTGRPIDMRYICSACARRLGAIWPRGHVATFHEAICPECKEPKSLASVDDWNWPTTSTTPTHAISGAGRD